MEAEYHVIGLMSGTSLDGLDIAFCRFSKGIHWRFEIIDAITIPYSEEWIERLSKAHSLNGNDLSLLNVELGILHGEWTRSFLNKRNHDPLFISSHGHTVFHQPESAMTLQVGSAAHIAALTGRTVVADFRTMDVALDGQGAPLVPIGDELLFSTFDHCLNLGGIANISMRKDGKRIAYDICVCNMALNHIASLEGKNYDHDGVIARTGTIDQKLLDDLNAHPFFSRSFPKSLGKEFFETEFLTLLNRHTVSNEDAMATIVEHIAIQIGRTTGESENQKLLITGGGAFNSFLVERIEANTTAMVVIPDEQIINFKEAIIFGFLGVLRWRNEVNCLASVTGASRDSVGGAVYEGGS